MSNISLASATGSRLDSAAKHIVVSRVCTDFYAELCGKMSALEDEKLKYLTKRDEICLGVGTDITKNSGSRMARHASGRAYVPIISNVFDFSPELKKFYSEFYDARDSSEIDKAIQQEVKTTSKESYIPCELFFGGVALTEGPFVKIIFFWFLFVFF